MGGFKAMNKERFSHDVIVCIRNGLDDVKNCLRSILRHWDGDIQDRLILVDDCSDEETKDFLQHFSSQHEFIDVLTLHERHYYTRAANAGLLLSSAQLRTLLNSDTIVTRDWAKKIQQTFKISEYIGVVGPLSNAASTQSVPFVKSSKTQTAINTLPPDVDVDAFAEFIAATGANRTTPFVPLVHGFCMTLRDNAIRDIGGFDEKNFPYGYGEENDFCFRAEDAGYLLAITLDAYVFHVKSKSYAEDERVRFMQEGGQNFAKKHGRDRVQRSVRFMQENPHLQAMRDTVIAHWPEHYRN